MKKCININLSEQNDTVANIAKNLLSNDGIIFNSLWANNGYQAIIDYFKRGIESHTISNNWINKISNTLKSKCGKYPKNNNYSKYNAMTYLSNLMLAGDGMGLENNDIL